MGSKLFLLDLDYSSSKFHYINLFRFFNCVRLNVINDYFFERSLLMFNGSTIVIFLLERGPFQILCDLVSNIYSCIILKRKVSVLPSAANTTLLLAVEV